MDTRRITLFHGTRIIATGTLDDITDIVRSSDDIRQSSSLLAFNDETGEQVDLDLLPPSASADAPTTAAKPGRGRPKLGVTSKEVTLLPQQWEWLAAQPGGTSAALRRIVSEAKKKQAGKDAVRASADAAYRFMTAVAGDMPGYENAIRALYAGQADDFAAAVAPWDDDVKAYALRLGESAF